MEDEHFDERRVNRFFENDIKFVERLDDEWRIYRQNDDEIAIIIDMANETVDDENIDDFRVMCEILYMQHQKRVNMYVFTVNCLIMTEPREINSIADFSLKMGCFELGLEKDKEDVMFV